MLYQKFKSGHQFKKKKHREDNMLGSNMLFSQRGWEFPWLLCWFGYWKAAIVECKLMAHRNCSERRNWLYEPMKKKKKDKIIWWKGGEACIFSLTALEVKRIFFFSIWQAFLEKALCTVQIASPKRNGLAGEWYCDCRSGLDGTLWVKMLYCSEMLAEQETEKSVDL